MENRLHFLSKHRPNSYVYHCFLGAVRGGHQHVLEYLTDNWRGVPSIAHFIDATVFGQTHLFEYIFRKGVPNVDEFYPAHVLYEAAFSGSNHTSLVEFLLDKGVNVVSQDVFFSAARSGLLDSIKAIVRRSKVPRRSLGYNILKVALRNRHLEMIKYFLEEDLINAPEMILEDAIVVGNSAISEYLQQRVEAGLLDRTTKGFVPRDEQYDLNRVDLAPPSDIDPLELDQFFAEQGSMFSSLSWHFSV